MIITFTNFTDHPLGKSYKTDFQSLDQQDRDTQEATMWVLGWILRPQKNSTIKNSSS